MQYNFDQSLGKITQQISGLLGKSLEELFAQHGIFITSEQWSIISLLSSRENPTQKDIGMYLIMDKVSVNRSLDYLERAGWVKRIIADNDRRSKMVSLTPEGFKLYQSLSHYAEQILQKALQDLGDEETSQLFSLLEKVYKNLA